ncbi:hypothetical protein HanXRQr2_Chr03g0119451 [Helianthus annuus]|uniref:Uncharacterized protein n=1 Tax=Helianthus annuus TaxID=4232 RepID=A0A9K3NWY7_HELAN|nr:hypothetical protein HanXRQr2_Chr03g0119451 [Helianthus annuus]KAJ0944372.1 hypothetical protein HanPSC8_Chr03g0115951 [Helianthus annuus]
MCSTTFSRSNSYHVLLFTGQIIASRYHTPITETNFLKLTLQLTKHCRFSKLTNIEAT